MKNYSITVNGNVYDVTVEEKTSSGPAAAPALRAAAPAAAPVPAPAAAAPAPAAPAPAAAPAPKASSSGTEGSERIEAPMPGKILDVKVSPGQAVKKGDVLVILEAMKMENEIVTPSDGVVAGIHVASGDSVVSGTLLATLN